MIHVIAEQATVEGTGDTPAAVIGYDGLIPAELIAESPTRPGAAVDPSRRRARRNGLPAVAGVGRLRPPPGPDLSLPELRGAGHGLRPRPHHPLRRRRADACIESEVSVPVSSPRQDVLGVARGTAPRRRGDLDRPDRRKYVTHPGSALIFPALCAPTGALPVTRPAPTALATRPR